MSKLVLVRQIEFVQGNDLLIINVLKGKSRYYRLSIGKYNKQYNNYEINFAFYKNLRDSEIISIINKHYSWIQNALEKKKKHIVVGEDKAIIHGAIVSINEYNNCFNSEIEKIKDRFIELSRLANVKGISLKFRKMKSRWGSFNKSKKVITLNKALVSLPYELIDYVICHELTHYYVFDHSKAFYERLSVLYPDYLQARRTIKKYSDIL